MNEYQTGSQEAQGIHTGMPHTMVEVAGTGNLNFTEWYGCDAPWNQYLAVGELLANLVDHYRNTVLTLYNIDPIATHGNSHISHY